MDEPALIRSAQRGDIEAFNTLVLTYQSQVYRVAYRIMGDAPAADDATQETFVSAWKGIGRFRGGSFKSWLLRTVTNACYDALRYNKRRPATSLDTWSGDGPDVPDIDDSTGLEEVIASDAESPPEVAERRELQRAIVAGMRQLPPDQRITFVLSDIQGMNYEEIADATQTSLGTVKSRLSRARARLRDYLLAQPELLGSSRRPE